MDRPGFEMMNGRPEARDPRQMTAAELAVMGHKAMSPMEAIRARCLDCSAGSPVEVRFCAHAKCPSWPFRMGKNPWRAPLSEAQLEARRESAARMARAVKNPLPLRASDATDRAAGTSLPDNDHRKKSPTATGRREGAV
jgi:hypothetical protein